MIFFGRIRAGEQLISIGPMTGRDQPPAPAPTTAKIVRRALRDAFAFPWLVLLAGMSGFGSLARDSGFGLDLALISTVGIWGLPGQVALVELYSGGGELAAVVMASSLANARFLPMAVALMPLLRRGLKRGGWSYALVQLMSINTWAAALRTAPSYGGRQLRLYFLVFAATCLTAACSGTAIGYFAAGSLPRPVTLGLIFLNPLFFALLFAGSKGRAVVLALVIGALVGPLVHLVLPDWGVLVTGVAAGTLAFALSRFLARREPVP